MLESCFKEGGYPDDMVNKETNSAGESPLLGRSKAFERSAPDNCGTGVLLFVNCNPVLCRLGQVICKNLCFLYEDEEFKQI